MLRAGTKANKADSGGSNENASTTLLACEFPSTCQVLLKKNDLITLSLDKTQIPATHWKDAELPHSWINKRCVLQPARVHSFIDLRQPQLPRTPCHTDTGTAGPGSGAETFPLSLLTWVRTSFNRDLQGPNLTRDVSSNSATQSILTATITSRKVGLGDFWEESHAAAERRQFSTWQRQDKSQIYLP